MHIIVTLQDIIGLSVIGFLLLFGAICWAYVSVVEWWDRRNRRG